jgi:RNA polymerase sigma-70 factor (ECF subfamily)
MSVTTTEELDRRDLVRLADGENRALDDLMARHGRAILHFLIRMLGDESVAEDLAQETFVRVYLHRRRFDPRRKPMTWLYTIAANLARDRLRWLARHPQLPLEAGALPSGQPLQDALPCPDPDPSAQLDSRERVDAIRQAVAALPEDLRLPLVLSTYEHRSQAEVAEVLGCSIKAVEMRVYRARQQLRAALAPLLPNLAA